MAEGPDGCLIISDTNNNCLRKVDVASGKVVTLVGGRGGKEAGYADGAGTDALFMLPVGLDVDRDGTIYVADSNNHAIRKVTPDGTVSTLAGSGSSGHADGQGTAAHFKSPFGLAIHPSGDLLVGDYNNHRIRRVGAQAVPPAGAGGALLPQIPSSFADDMRRMLADPQLADKAGTGSALEYNERLIDNMCMQLVQKPELYDVIVTQNLYGDILSDLCAGLVGGLGVAPGANIGEEGAIFEATHGSAPKYKGQNKVNPVALILSGKMMLDHLGERDAAAKLERAVGAEVGPGLCAQIAAVLRELIADQVPSVLLHLFSFVCCAFPLCVRVCAFVGAWRTI